MTPAQHMTLDQLQRAGFQLVVEGGDVVRVTRHGDCRVILQDGLQKRGHHVDRHQPKPGARR